MGSGGEVIGVDLGGTWMRAARVKRATHGQAKPCPCHRLDIVKQPTHAQRPAEEIVESLVAMCRAMGERKLRVVRSELGPAAGVLGAASLVQMQEESA